MLAVLITAGAVGGGGYWYVRQQSGSAQPTAPATTAPAPSPDEAIIAAVKTALAAVPQFQSLEVTARNGVVTLDGSVPTQALAEQAARIASAQPSVKDVRNQIDFPPVAVAAPPPTQPVAEKAKSKPELKPVAAKPVRERKPEGPAQGAAAQQRRQLQELLAEGERLTNSGAYAAAIDTYNSALAIDPNDPSARAGLNRARQAKATEEEILLRRRK